ncbi:MAG: hypothetical protein OEQ28_04855 [Acidobacteriota bacterium]|nr:hypothetical protein [Acidobacteriota bacterium]
MKYLIVLVAVSYLQFACIADGGELERQYPEKKSAAFTNGENEKEIVALVRKCRCVEKDDPKLVKLMSMPREKLVPVLERLKLGETSEDLSEDEVPLLKLKSAFLLYKLTSNRTGNEAYIVEIASEKTSERNVFIKAESVAYLGVLIRDGKKNLLTVLFSTVKKSDAALSQEILDVFRAELDNSLETFLRKLSKEPRERRKEVFNFLKLLPEDELDKVKLRVERLEKGDLESISSEFLEVL